MAMPFDLERMMPTKEPVAVLEGVRGQDYAISANGTLAYVPADDGTGRPATAKLVWMNRAGRVVGDAVPEPLDDPRDVRISPDGRRLAVVTGQSEDGDLWVHDFGGRPPLRLFDGANNSAPVWSPDGKRVAFASGGAAIGAYPIYWMHADGSDREPHPAYSGAGIAGPSSWSSRDLLVSAFVPGAGFDIRAASLDSHANSRAVIASSGIERAAQLSPDGQWLAYESNRSGQIDVWVQSYSGGPPIRVSRGGGVEPVWSRDGRELFYLRGMTLMAATIRGGPSSLAVESETALFDLPFKAPTAGAGSRSYDVAPDGRVLVFQPSAASVRTRPGSSIVVVQNWIEELKRLVPTD
jgi:dipeptidyl aminopeptidase/acylaminoacyl peptidase